VVARLAGAVLLIGVLAGTAFPARAQQAPGSAPAPPAPAQTPPSATRASGFDSARAWLHLQRMVEIGPRPAGSTALRQTRAYITRQLTALGLTVQEQPFTVTTPAGRVQMVNLIVRLPGTRPDRILFAGHYDTKVMPGARPFVGASDGGSSAAFLIELASALNSRPRDFTYELIWLDGEEAFCPGWTDCGTPSSPDNTYGSRHYVAAATEANALPAVRALILVDMIGDIDLQVRRDTNSTPWLVDLVWTAARRLGHGGVFVQAATAVEDDHLPFVRAGVPSVDIIDLDYPYWHTPDDDMKRVSARSLQIVGDVVLEALPAIESRLRSSP
jgi:hypothetical protein